MSSLCVWNGDSMMTNCYCALGQTPEMAYACQFHGQLGICEEEPLKSEDGMYSDADYKGGQE
ncbi:hypothetical protein UFOVP1138_54 [uncultured Caudovirales phage]|uniref:Uncharacterized protein n=1 Tax=uncultured Caudovirales phage TaxID=2100421 RepID=A0A6J5PWV6_9CAUD|nr:hypothetical protein UFOVP975_66 [uncultured Caudovirales phage]CAB4186277.1 hypothetical protein UFOVP1138_54 [uncultured Caudovirales phage]CAB4204431.1 hypothetical protein UFOVP1394_51 [uncultured Caudovirales phage]